LRGPLLECLTPPHNVCADRPSFHIGGAPAFKKTGEPVLTLPQAQRLIIAGLSGNEELIRKTLNDVNYHMKRNMVAYLSHRKRNLQLLAEAVI